MLAHLILFWGALLYLWYWGNKKADELKEERLPFDKY
jgi:hypothetical protein